VTTPLAVQQTPLAPGMTPAEVTARLQLAKLLGQLDRDKPTLVKYDKYYRGEHGLVFASKKWVGEFGKQLAGLRDNWMELVVDAVDERLNVEGFRFGDDTAADKDAWRIWQHNQLDSDSQIGHSEALIFGRSYVMVWPNSARPEMPTITVESPLEVYVAHAPGDRRRRVAGVKKWIDEDGVTCATLYTPTLVWKFKQQNNTEKWVPRRVGLEDWPLKNPLGEVPFLSLRNKPRLLGDGVSEIDRVIPLQDAVNDLLRKMLLAAEYSAYKQRWATGIEIPEDADGNPVEPFDAAVDRLWTNEDKDGKFGEFGETDLSNYTKAVEMVVQHIASQTRTPPHYFYLSGQFPSGESVKSAETGLVAKSRRKMRHFGETWEDVIRLAFKAAGNDDRAAATHSETIWADPESRTEGEHVDATMKKKTLAVPLQQLWSDLGYSPTQIEAFMAMKREEARYAVGMTGLGELLEPKPDVSAT
jgi:hypothetical protein